MNTRECRERLIDEVKRYPVLYDTRHEHHRDIDVRDKCWIEIAQRLNTKSEVLKKEWKILRDSLRQALKKSRDTITTKAGVPCKKWRFQTRMAFLLPYMTRRNDTRNDKDVKLGADTEHSQAGYTEEASGVNAFDADALDLFFASVCTSARRLPREQQRALKRRVLDALLDAEQQADNAPAAAPTAAPTATARRDAHANSKATLLEHF